MAPVCILIVGGSNRCSMGLCMWLLGASGHACRRDLSRRVVEHGPPCSPRCSWIVLFGCRNPINQLITSPSAHPPTYTISHGRPTAIEARRRSHGGSTITIIIGAGRGARCCRDSSQRRRSLRAAARWIGEAAAATSRGRGRQARARNHDVRAVKVIPVVGCGSNCPAVSVAHTYIYIHRIRSAPAPALRRLEAVVQEAVELMTPDPADALRRGTWFKLICGASYQVGRFRGIGSSLLACSMAQWT